MRVRARQHQLRDKAAGCQKAFRRVYESLRPGGLFVFDINTPYKLEGLDGQVFLDETEDSYCVWRAVYDKRHSLCRYGMDLFSGWRMIRGSVRLKST